MFREFTFRVEPGPHMERIVEDLAQYSRWAETLEAFQGGKWGTLSN